MWYRLWHLLWHLLWGSCLLIRLLAPYLHRVTVLKDPRMHPWHIPLGPLLWKDNPPIYFPGKTSILVDHYLHSSEERSLQKTNSTLPQSAPEQACADGSQQVHEMHTSPSLASLAEPLAVTKGEAPASHDGDDLTRAPLEDVELQTANAKGIFSLHHVQRVEPEERFLMPTAHLSVFHPKRIWGFFLYIALQGVTRDCVSHDSAHMAKVHGKARRYDNRIEHL